MLHNILFRYLVERDLFSIVFDWLAILDARPSSLSVGIVFETWCRPRTRPPLSLRLSSGFQETRTIHIFLHIFFPLLGSETPLGRPHQSKPAQLTHTSLLAAGATAVHQTGVRYTLCSFYGSCWCLASTHTHVSTAVRVVSADLGFYTIIQVAETERVRAYVITGIHILCTT